ncbi:twin-arginine translocase subunit TatC [Dietzia sp. PP-33]|uniref:twin-arginine translocase subunit TatC n=1 Tax=Dietzia sp. PP-33 TaxID=2957500 RepID=UPI0029B50E64|nr:twin-arginine translocase subunit TatC [Dietzia sp. PP-33]MDX2355391.1 twin-arginine translocase subunit TatC [Dietzia sp. PP-33]
MPLIEHIYELRTRLLIAVAAIVVTLGFGFWWYGTGFLGVPSLGGILTGPYCDIPPGARLQLGDSGDECRLLATGPFEQFMLRLKVAATAGIVLASPVWLYQLWAFITPGLHKNEKRYGVVFTILAAMLFIGGAVLAYIVIVHALEFLLSIGDNVQTTALSGTQYFTFLIQLILIFGVSFEIPLLIAMLNVAGVLSYEVLARSRRGIIMGVFVFAAVASPGQDPFSMLALAVAVCLLVEVSIQFARLHDRRRKKAQADWLEVDDESASPLHPAEGVDGSGPVRSTGPLSTSEPLGSRPLQAPAGGALYDDTI